jgi:hypothetical protein
MRRSGRGALDRLPVALRLPLALLLVSVAFLGACGPAPHGTPVDDPGLKELLRPDEPVERERLLDSGSEIFYEAELRERPSPDYRSRYLAELEDRGFSIRVSGTSPHNPIHRVIGYRTVVVQEAKLEPYTIRYKSARDIGEPITGLLSLFPWNFPHPISLSGRRLVVRLGSDFLKPWVERVVVPDQSVAALPADLQLPLPPTAAVVHVKDGRLQPSHQLWVTFIARIPPRDVVAFYKPLMAKTGEVKVDLPEQFLVVFRTQPPNWLPSDSTDFYLIPQHFLFSEGEVAVGDARHSFFKRDDQFDNGEYQPRTLRHVPKDAWLYWIRVNTD